MRQLLVVPLVGALLGAGLSVPAHAAPSAATSDVDTPAPVLRWEVSQQFDDHLSTHVLEDGASEDAEGVITFPDGVGSHDPVTGVSSVAYQGVVRGSFAFAGTEYYHVRIEDPALSVDEAGRGELTAVVSAGNAAAMGSSAEETQPARVVLTTFRAGTEDWSGEPGDLASLAATPDWAGVLAPGSQEAGDLGLEGDEPVDGQAWSPAFLGQVTSGVRAHFYASGSGSDAKKAPASFVAEASRAAAPPSTSVSTTSADRDALVLRVEGSGFTGVTNPGDDGVYVGLAPAGGLPDVDDRESGTEAFAAVAWVPAAQMTDGTFGVDLDADPADLDYSQDWSVYTWRAHTHSTTSQDTEQPVEIDWVAVGLRKGRSTLQVATKRQPSAARAGVLKVRVAGDHGRATGTVVTKLTKGERTRRVSDTLNGRGRTSVRLPKVAKGRWKVVVRYTGSSTYQRAVDRSRVTVR